MGRFGFDPRGRVDLYSTYYEDVERTRYSTLDWCRWVCIMVAGACLLAYPGISRPRSTTSPSIGLSVRPLAKPRYLKRRLRNKLLRNLDQVRSLHLRLSREFGDVQYSKALINMLNLDPWSDLWHSQFQERAGWWLKLKAKIAVERQASRDNRLLFLLVIQACLAGNQLVQFNHTT